MMRRHCERIGTNGHKNYQSHYQTIKQQDIWRFLM